MTPRSGGSRGPRAFSDALGDALPSPSFNWATPPPLPPRSRISSHTGSLGGVNVPDTPPAPTNGPLLSRPLMTPPALPTRSGVGPSAFSLAVLSEEGPAGPSEPQQQRARNLSAAGTMTMQNCEDLTAPITRGKSNTVCSTPTAAASDSSKRFRVAAEVLATEQSFVKSLDTCVRVFHAPLAALAAQGDQTVSETVLNTIFSNLPLIADFNSKFCSELEARMSGWDAASTTLGDLFLQYIPFFKMYTQFTYTREAANVALKKQRKNDKFKVRLSSYFCCSRIYASTCPCVFFGLMESSLNLSDFLGQAGGPQPRVVAHHAHPTHPAVQAAFAGAAQAHGRRPPRYAPSCSSFSISFQR